MANSVLADEILEGMEKIDQLVLQVKEAEKSVEAIKNDLLKFRDGVAAEGQVIGGDIARLEKDLAEAEKNLPASLRDDYQRVIRGKGADGMASVEDLVCQGCGQKITLNMQNELMLSHPIFCKNCGSLLYLAE
jgi:predicted  nucleic acid-binding Zn-ribbon protein